MKKALDEQEQQYLLTALEKAERYGEFAINAVKIGRPVAARQYAMVAAHHAKEALDLAEQASD
jgi:hypothetical protein